MTSLEEYGRLLRQAFSALHGGGDEPPPRPRPEEGWEDFMARSRAEALGPLLEGLRATSPPPGLEGVHATAVALVESALRADAALVAQVRAYQDGDFQASEARAEEVARLVAETARLDRRLILALAALERERPGTLQALGLSIPLPKEADTRPEEGLP